MKNIITVLSLVLNVVLIAYLLIVGAPTSGSKESVKETAEQKKNEEIVAMKNYIMEQELKELPLTLQGLYNAKDVTIDSVVITNTEYPYKGYLVTTWDVVVDGVYGKKSRGKQTVYVELNNIYSHGDNYSYNAEWKQADMRVFNKEL